MTRIALTETTLPLLLKYYRGFHMDPELYMDMSRFREYVYSPEAVEAYFAKLKAAHDRVDFMVMLEDEPIGELALKRVDRTAGHCELSIHLQSDAVKNRGYGTIAERLALEYAFGKLNLRIVHANAVLKNTRSQRVLEKVGFERTGEDDAFVYYRLTKEDWKEKY